MTEVTCGYVMCKYNESCKPGVSGECLKHEINLIFGKTEDEELEYLDCSCFKWDNNKKLVKE